MGKPLRAARLAFLLGSLAGLTGCVSLVPYSEVRRQAPPENFLFVDGRAVYVEQHGQGEPLVLLHGFGESAFTWRKIVPDLARSYRTIALDLHGFGWTERPQEAAAYTRDGQLRLVLGVLDQLGVDSAVWLGHSYGGALAASLAVLHPERVKALVLIDSAAPTYPDSTKSRVAGVRPLARVALPLALSTTAIRRSLKRAFFDDALATRELAREYRQRLAVEGVLEAYVHLSAPASPSRPVKLAEITQPTLVIWGQQDLTIPIAGARKTTGQIPNARFVAIPRCGHSPTEEQPTEVLAALLPFLQGLNLGGGGTPTDQSTLRISPSLR